MTAALLFVLAQVVCAVGGAVLGVLAVFVLVMCIRHAQHKRAASEYHSVTFGTSNSSSKKKKKHHNSSGIGMDDIDEPLDPRAEQEENTALMNAMFFLRGHPEYELDHPLRRIGSRRGKHFYLLNARPDGADGRAVEAAAVLELVPQGPDCAVSVAGEAVVFGHMFRAMGHAHPNVETALLAEVIPATNVLAVVRPWHKHGSLRDFLHQSDPQHQFRHKYSGGRTPMTAKNIAKYGRDVLEGMLFLKQLGVPCYHLHAGNVLVDPPRRCTITDIENNVLGLAPRHAGVIRELAAKGVEPDVACFACVLYEMAAGAELTTLQQADVLLSPTSSCPDAVRNVLTSILAPWATRPPDVEDLLRLDLFAAVVPDQPVPKLAVTMPTTVQQLFAASADALAASVAAAHAPAVPPKSPRSQHPHVSYAPQPAAAAATTPETHEKKKTEKASLLPDRDSIEFL